MRKIIFDQPSIFHLYRLSHLCFVTSGVRHKLSDESSMFSLIKDCSSSTDPSVNRQFDAFLSSVDDETTALLVATKIVPSSYQRLNSHSKVA